MLCAGCGEWLNKTKRTEEAASRNGTVMVRMNAKNNLPPPQQVSERIDQMIIKAQPFKILIQAKSSKYLLSVSIPVQIANRIRIFLFPKAHI